MPRERVILLAVCFLACQTLPAAPPSHQALRFYRVLVPAGNNKQLSQAGYFPIQREKFAEYLKTIRSKQSEFSLQAKITRADYTARFQNGTLVSSQTRLKIQKAKEEGSAILELGQISCALRDPVWTDVQQPAMVGLANTGRTVLIVPRSDNLDFAWSQQAKRLANGDYTLDLRLPPSPVSRFVLSVPDKLTPSVTSGILRRTGKSQFAGQPHTDWEIQLGGSTRFQLRLISQSNELQAFVQSRQKLTYRFDLPGLTLQSDIQLNVRDKPLRQLVLEVETPLQVTQVRLGGKSLVFRSQTQRGRNLVTVDFAEPLIGSERLLRVIGISPMMLGRNWNLPLVRPLDTSWQQATAELVIPKQIDLAALVLRGARQSQVVHQLDGGESRHLQFYGPKSSVQIRLARRRGQLIASNGTTIKLQTGSLRAEFVTDLLSSGPGLFEASLNYPALWEIDQVSTEPADALEQTLQQRLNGAGSRRLLIKLKRPFTADRSIRIRVSAHHRFPPRPRTAISARNLRIFHVRNARQTQHLVGLNVAIPTEIKLIDDAILERVDPSKISAADRTRLTLNSTSKIVRVSPQTDSVRFQWRKGQARFAARIDMEVQRTEKELHEVYRIRCLPSSLAMSKLVVHLSQSRPGPIEWTIGDAKGKSLPATRIAEADASQGENWSIQLQPSRADPFEIVGRRSTSTNGPMKISVASLPNANLQEGQLSVFSPMPLGWKLSGNMKSSPAIHQRASSRQLIGSYRYDPVQNETLTIASSERDSRQSLWVWDYWLRSRFAASGRIQHRLRLRCENAGQTKLVMKFPEALTIDLLRIDGRERSIEGLIQASGSNSVVNIPLASAQRFPVVEIEYHQVGPGLGGLLRSTLVHVPTVAAPVLNRRWTPRLPSGYSVAQQRMAQSHWFDRLQYRFFGPFAKLRFGAGNAPQQDSQERLALTLLQAIGVSLDPSQTVDWGDWLAAYASHPARGSDSLPNLKLDSIRLLATGITPRRIVPADDTVLDPLLRAAKVLRESNAILVSTADAVVLSSRRVLTESSARKLAGSDVIFTTSKTAREFCRSNWLDTASAWNMRPGRFRVPWAKEKSVAYQSFAEHGWRSFQQPLAIELSSEQPASVALPIVEHSILRGMVCVALLAAVAIGWLISRANRRMWLIMSLLAGGLACVAFEPLVPLTAGLFWGALTGGLIPVLARSSFSDRMPDQSTDKSTATLAWNPTAALVLFLCAIAAAAWSLPLFAGDPPSKTTPKKSTVASTKKTKKGPLYRVLDPVDKDGKPAGKYLRIPTPFFEALVQRSAAAKGSSLAWLISRASYRCRIVANQQQPPSVVATYQLQVRRTGAQVAIPFPNGVLPLIQSATVDGKSVGVRWQPGSSNLLIDVTGTGTYTLVLTFGLPPAIIQTQQLEIPVPRVAQSTLQVATDLSPTAIHVHSAGPVTYDNSSKELRAELGPVDRLSIRWSSQKGGIPLASAMAEQLMWLNIKPHSVVVHAKINLKSLSGPQQIRLITDRKLRLIGKSWSGELQITKGENQDQAIIVDIKRSDITDGRATLEAQFLVTDTTGIGILVAPRLEVSGAQLMSRLIGVTADPLLHLQSQQELDTVAAKQFLQAWGNAQTPVQITFRQDSGDADPQFSTRFRKPLSKAKQKLTITYHRRISRLRFSAEIDTSDGSRFHHSLSVPQRLQIEKIQVRQGDEEIHVSRPRRVGGSVTAFFGKELRGKYTLTLTGRLPHRIRQELGLPRITLSDSSLENDEIHIRRHPHARLDLIDRGMKGYERFSPTPPAANKMAKSFVSLRRLVGNLSATYVAPRVRVYSNRSQASSLSVVRVDREAETWTATIDHSLKVTQGLLDTVRLEVPDSWVGPFTISPKMAHEVIDLPETSRKILVLKPDLPLRSGLPFRARISGPISKSGTPPNIVPLDVTNQKRYVLLPRQGQQQTFRWEAIGLRRIIWEGGWTKIAKSLANDPQSYEAYQVVGAHFQAAIKQVQLDSRTALVRLADHLARIRRDGAFDGISTFDIEPAGQSTTILKLPAVAKLIFVRVAGLPGRIESIRNGQWTLHFASDQLPQRVEVCYRGKLRFLPQSKKRISFIGPEIHKLDVEHTIWTVHGPFWSRRVSSGAPTASSARQEQVRLDAYSTILDLPSDLVSREKIGPWARPWFERFAVSRRMLAEASLSVPVLSGVDESRILDLEQQQSANAIRLGVGTEYQNVVQKLNASGTAQLRWQQVHESDQNPVLRRITPGNQSTVTVVFSGTGTESWWVRSANVTLFLAVVCMGFVFAGVSRRLILSGVSLHLIGVAVGLILWCLFTPSWFGLAVAILSGLAAVSDLLRPNSTTR